VVVETVRLGRHAIDKKNETANKREYPKTLSPIHFIIHFADAEHSTLCPVPILLKIISNISTTGSIGLKKLYNAAEGRITGAIKFHHAIGFQGLNNKVFNYYGCSKASGYRILSSKSSQTERRL